VAAGVGSDRRGPIRGRRRWRGYRTAGAAWDALFGLVPTDQRYFDYHHSRRDTIDKVNPRELELGALALAILAWQLSEEGL